MRSNDTITRYVVDTEQGGFPKGFRGHGVKLAVSRTLVDLPAPEIVAFFRRNEYMAEALFAEACDKRFTPSSFVSRRAHGTFEVGRLTRKGKTECVRRFSELADAAADYLLFSLGKSRWTASTQ